MSRAAERAGRRGALPQAVVGSAAVAVGAMSMNQRVALADEIFVHQPNLLASVLVLQRMGARLQQMEVVLHILLVAYQAMKLSGQHWPVIPESTQERCLQRLTGRIRFAEGLAAEQLQRAVQDSIDEHGEPHLLAFAFGQLRQHDLLTVRTEAEKYLLLAGLNLVDCIADSASSRPRPKLPRRTRSGR